jgi:hypothetical protein
MKEFWDERFGEEEYAYGIEPNSFFREQIGLLSPGSLLLPAEGEGRNAVYAAGLGWDVTAVDYSVTAKKKALLLANEKGVEIEYKNAALADYRCHSKFNAVGLVYIHFRPEDRVRFHHSVVNCLQEGATLIAELFHKDQLLNRTGGPPSIEMLYTSEMLREDFKALEIDYLADERITLEEGRYHNGPADVVRLVARKL